MRGRRRVATIGCKKGREGKGRGNVGTANHSKDSHHSAIAFPSPTSIMVPRNVPLAFSGFDTDAFDRATSPPVCHLEPKLPSLVNLSVFCTPKSSASPRPSRTSWKTCLSLFYPDSLDCRNQTRRCIGRVSVRRRRRGAEWWRWPNDGLGRSWGRSQAFNIARRGHQRRRRNRSCRACVYRMSRCDGGAATRWSAGTARGRRGPESCSRRGRSRGQRCCP